MLNLFRKTTASPGFSLIEILIYIVLIIIITSGLITFTWNVIYSSVKSEAQLEVNHNLRVVADRIDYELRNASGLNYLTATGICVASTDTSRNPTRIYLNGSVIRIAWGGGSANCTGMLNDQVLTSNSVQVNSLNFVDNSAPGGESTNVSYQLGIRASNSAAQDSFNFEQAYQSSVEMRTIN